ncbi:MAG: TIGR03790 family protein [Polyangiaceae bacterium]
MRTSRAALLFGFSAASIAFAGASPARAGGGPMNVLVLYSSDDAKSTEVAQLYAEQRDIPTAQLCGLPGFTPADTTIDVATYQSKVAAPFDACLAALADPTLIDIVVLTRGLPYMVTLPNYTASLEAMVQVGHAKVLATGQELAGQGQPDASASVPNPLFDQNDYFNAAESPVQNQYSAWYASGSSILHRKDQPASFRRSAVTPGAGYDFSGNLFIVQSLDGFDYEDAKAVATRGKASDGALPSGELLCMHGEDEARGARDPECELVTRMLENAGLNGVFVDPFDGALAGHDVMAYFTGSADTVKNAIAGNTFGPGAIAENLTSFGAAINNFSCNADGSVCPGSESQTSIARFIRAGASGAHGTVNEPYNNVFPNAGTMLFYTFGYSMGESFLFNQRFLYWQNIHIGDPLATPYAKRPVVEITADTSALVVKATHADGVAAIDIYRDGKLLSHGTGDTLSVPSPGNAGETLDLLAVATAQNATVTRAGWPEEMQSPKPDVQGWLKKKVVVEEVSTGGGGAGGSGGSGGETSTAGGGTSAGGTGGDDTKNPGGCGCRTGTDPRGEDSMFGAALVALAVSVLRARSRRESPSS